MSGSTIVGGAGRQGGPEALFSPEAVRGLARERLSRTPPAGHNDDGAPVAHGEHQLNREPPPSPPASGLRRAAVLVPLIAHPDGVSVLLTRRTDHLASHAGQIAFPGGKIEATDATPLEAALREAGEEVGLKRADAEPLGYLDLYQTGTGYRIVPAVALVDPDARFVPHDGEVAALFEVPLAFLMSPANHQRHSRVLGGLERRFYAMPYGEHFIWGATAGIIRNLYNRVYG